MHHLSFLVVVLQSVNVLLAFRDSPANISVSLPSQRLQRNKASVYADPFRNVLSRKRRSFVFYKGTVVVLTDVCALAIPGATPRALVQSNEIDMFYDVPLLVDGWRKPVDDFIDQLKAKSKEYKEEEEEDEKLKNVGVVNASAIPLKEYNKLAYVRPSWSQYPVRLQSNRRNWGPSRRRYPEWKWRPNYRGSNNYYYPSSHRRNYVQPKTTTTTTTAPLKSTPSQLVAEAYDETDRSFHEAKRDTMKTPQKRHNNREYHERRELYDDIETFGQMRPNYRGSSEYYYPSSLRRNYVQTTTKAPLKPTPSQLVMDAYDETDRSFHEAKREAMKTPQKWHNHREYRERRALYDHIETFGKMLGVSLRKCVQRAICEMREELLPEGESLINDIARILFTIPTEHDEQDEFTEIAREKNVDCARRFMVSCPHSPMQYFFTNFRASGQPSRPPTAEEAINSIIYA